MVARSRPVVSLYDLCINYYGSIMNDEQVREELRDRLEELIDNNTFPKCGGMLSSFIMELLEDYDITKVINE